jgi:N-acetylglucosamine kinase-like BadF-type ATPase
MAQRGKHNHMPRMKQIASLFTALFLTACATDYGTNRIIGNDRGGYVVEYALAVQKAPQSEQIRLTGTCMSACTLWLAHKNVCVGKRAKLVFHQATTKLGTQYLMQSYAKTPGLVQWINARGGLSSRALTMDSKTARRLIRRCV